MRRQRIRPAVHLCLGGGQNLTFSACRDIFRSQDLSLSTPSHLKQDPVATYPLKQRVEGLPWPSVVRGAANIIIVPPTEPTDIKLGEGGRK